MLFIWGNPLTAAAAEAVPVPSMGDSISEGTVVEWLKGAASPAWSICDECIDTDSLPLSLSIYLLVVLVDAAPGDYVEVDEVVVVLETDKVGHDHHRVFVLPTKRY